jgi:hypothetical protein
MGDSPGGSGAHTAMSDEMSIDLDWVSSFAFFIF